MAILFSKPINVDKLRMAYNNDVIRFSSNIATNPSYCDITATGLQVRLYPGPDGRFFFNFMPFISALINSYNFQDTLSVELDSANAASYIHDYDGTLLERDVTISITNLLQTDAQVFSLSWLAGVMQLNDHHEILKTDHFVMTPYNRDTTNKFYVKYFQGYPFDISFYFPSETLHLKNETNLLEAEFTVPAKVSRLFFSDGRIDETIDDILPLIDGYNSIRIMTSNVETEDDKMLTVEKAPAGCGVYLKWFNKFGGYSYWLFESTYSIDRSSKQIGELERDNSNLEDTFARTSQLGKTSQDSYRIIAELLTEEQRAIVEGIIDSPKIYLFTGAPYSRASANDWTEVALKTSGIRIKNPKQELTNFVFDIELPERYTQTL